MAFRQGRYTEITISGVSLSSYCDSVEISRDTDMIETTTFTKTSKTYLTGLMDGKLDIAGKYEPTITVGPAFLLSTLVGAPNSVPVAVYPGGSQTGQTVRQFSAFLTSYNESSAVGDLVKFKASFQIDGAVTASGL